MEGEQVRTQGTLRGRGTHTNAINQRSDKREREKDGKRKVKEREREVNRERGK